MQRHKLAAVRQASRTVKPLRLVITRYSGDQIPSAPRDGYICLGLAHCFEKSDDGKLAPRVVIEPIGASSLECMATGAKTSFKAATATTLAEALQRDKDLLPHELQEGAFCENFEYRCEAAARTWQRPHAQDNLMDLIPLGKVRANFNFNLEDKRVLNFENVVDDSDNIKQDISIDVYGRKEKQEQEEAAAKAAAEAAAAAAQEEPEEEVDELDALLAA